MGARLSAPNGYFRFGGALSRLGPEGFPVLDGPPAPVLPPFPPLVRFPPPRLALLPPLFPLDFGIVLSAFLIVLGDASEGHFVPN